MSRGFDVELALAPVTKAEPDFEPVAVAWTLDADAAALDAAAEAEESVSEALLAPDVVEAEAWADPAFEALVAASPAALLADAITESALEVTVARVVSTLEAELTVSLAAADDSTEATDSTLEVCRVTSPVVVALISALVMSATDETAALDRTSTLEVSMLEMAVVVATAVNSSALEMAEVVRAASVKLSEVEIEVAALKISEDDEITASVADARDDVSVGISIEDEEAAAGSGVMTTSALEAKVGVSVGTST